ncbi:hypothetical protein C4568_01160 [Candidatus Parcubacteria bacterium]|nr:MAG: hypothetical protein C4568_01160 [Candidatus Parcubacteria bacterium]
MYADPEKVALAYIVGVALGDGNLSKVSRAIRLRITCDTKYSGVSEEIQKNLKMILPNNRISIVRVPGKNTFHNISIYSNKLSELMPWKVGLGTKYAQKARVPDWIKCNTVYMSACLRGLIQTDGSIYEDRGYRMINFTNQTQELIEDVAEMSKCLGLRPMVSKTMDLRRPKYTVRFARKLEVEKLIALIGLHKR